METVLNVLIAVFGAVAIVAFLAAGCFDGFRDMWNQL